MQTSESDGPILNRRNLLRELLRDIRTKGIEAHRHVRKLTYLSRIVTIVIALLNVLTLISITLVLALPFSLLAMITSLSTQVLSFLLQTLRDGSDMDETLAAAKTREAELTLLERDLNLILIRNHLTSQDIERFYQEFTDRLQALEATRV